jgi:hypothetical protein
MPELPTREYRDAVRWAIEEQGVTPHISVTNARALLDAADERDLLKENANGALEHLGWGPTDLNPAFALHCLASRIKVERDEAIAERDALREAVRQCQAALEWYVDCGCWSQAGSQALLAVRRALGKED